MRTTLTIDDDVLAVAKELAEQRGAAVGEVISELSRLGLESQRRQLTRSGRIPTFAPRPNAPAITMDAVNSALDDE